MSDCHNPYINPYIPIHPAKSEVEKLEERINKLEEMQSAMLSMPNVVWQKYNKTPHKCPVCDGLGLKNTKTQVFIDIKCNACEGKGIVWG